MKENIVQGLWEYGENADKTVTIICYWGEESDISVPETVDGKRVSGIGDWAFSRGDSLLIDQRRNERKRITSVKLPSGIKYLGKYAFKGLKSLETVFMPKGLEYIGGHAFEDCENLKNVVFPDGLKYIGDRLFDGCNALKFNEFENGLYISREGNPYYLLCGLIDKDVYSFEINVKTEIISSCAFSGCKNLTDVSFGEEDGVTLVCANAFSHCPSLACVSFSSKINEIREGQFYSCPSLKRVNIYGKNIKGIRFSTRNGLEKDSGAVINAPFLPPSVFCDEEKENAALGFAEASENGGITDENVRILYIEYIKKSADKLMGYLKKSAPLLDIFISEKLLDKAQTDALLDDASLPSTSRAALIQYSKISFGQGGFDLGFELDFEDLSDIGQWEYEDYGDGITLKKYLGRAKEVVLPEKIDGRDVVSIGTDAFEENGTIISVILPKTLKTVENGALRGLEGLKGIEFPEAVKSIGAYAFENCVSLEYVTFYGELTRINDGTFAGSGIKTFRCPGGVLEIGHKAFENCAQLKEIVISKGVKAIPVDAFSGCNNLSKAYIPESVEKIFGLKYEKLTVYGKRGSYAEKYAVENGMEFAEYEY